MPEARPRAVGGLASGTRGGQLAVVVAAATALLFVSVLPVSGQSAARFGLDTAVSVNQFVGENAADRPDIIVDLTLSARLGKGWVGYIRPWFRKASNDPYEQVTEIYQAAIQREHVGRVSTRLDLGYLLSPIGLGLMDMRADTNPTILPHFAYLMPMPSFDRAAPRSWPIASSYPPGAQFTASTTKWDTRVALLGSPPNRSFVLNADGPNPPSRPIVVFGGGVTPRTGLRFGAGMSVGNYATESELLPPIVGTGTPASNGGRGLRMLALEAEWAFGFTKLSGEFTHDVIETASGTTTADEWFVQGIQTLAPRWFVAGRHEGANAPPSPATLSLRSTLRISEATLGYRLSRELTLRGSFVSRKLYFGPQHDQQAGASLVWARRWW